MPATIGTPPPAETAATAADWLASLGGVPLERVRMRPLPGTATEADALRHNCVELVNGTLVEKAMGQKESRLAMQLVYLLIGYLQTHDLGWVSGPDAAARMTDENVRLPDVSFFRWDQFPGSVMPDEKVAGVSPRLAVEVLSESNTSAEIAMKLAEFFASGTALAWVIDPRKRTAHAHTAPEAFTELTDADTLEGGPVLPGFRVTLADLFSAADRRTPGSQP
jgi:Uma2 family endonuclease